MDWKLFRIKLYESIYLFRVPALWLSLILAGASGTLAFRSIQDKDWLPAGLGLALAVGAGLCISFLVWFFPTLRFARWWTTRHFYRGLRWLNRPGLLLAGVAVALLVFWAADLREALVRPQPESQTRATLPDADSEESSQKEPAEDPIWQETLTNALNLLVVVLLITVLREIGRARRRIVVQSFLDHTVEDSDACKARGEALSALLRSEIAGITSLYKVIDEVSPSKTSVEATVGVQDVGERLKEAVGSDSKLKLFGVEIPVGSLASMISWMVRGPRLTGSLHHEEKEGGKKSLVLLAQIEGGGLSGNWRVHLSDLKAEDQDIDAPGHLADEPEQTRMIRQMAFRIVTQLVSVGSPRWQAVRHYTEGLRYYRDTRHVQRDKALNLCRAERSFIRALAHDQKFSQCHYNLGVVYRELDKLPSAEAAFRRAMEESEDAPGSLEAAYGLAQERFDEERFGSAVDCCNTAIRICPEDARAWNLKGWALRRSREDQGRRKGLPAVFSDWLKRRWASDQPAVRTPASLAPLEPEHWKDICLIREVAAALAWRSLCQALRKSDRPDPQTWIAAACTVNSGIAYCLGVKSGYRASQRFWQAIHLYGDLPALRLEMGKARCQAGDWEGAVEALTPIFSYQASGRDLLELLLYRMAAYDMLPDKDSEILAKFDCQRLMDLACIDLEEREFLRQAVEKVESVRHKRFESSGPKWLHHLELSLYILEGLERDKAGPGGVAEEPAAYIDRLRRIDGILKSWGKLSKEESLAQLRAWLHIVGKAVALEPEGWKDDRSAHFEHLMSTVTDFSWKRMEVHSKILLAQELLTQRDDPEAAAEAIGKLDEVLAIFKQDEHIRDLQIRNRHLYDLLAKAHGILGRPRFEGAAPDRSALTQALAKANESVLHQPEGARERLSLGRVYARFGDYDQAEDELRTSWQLDPGPEALQEIAITGWERGCSRLDPEQRKQELSRLADILDKGLDITEVNNPNEKETAEKHGMIHHWLGRFRGELLDADAALYNLRISRAMGFKPIESSLIIGQICLDANAFSEAEKAFRDGLVEAQRQLRCLESGQPGTGKSRRDLRVELAQRPAAAAGEERPINDLQIEILLGWALALAERRGDLKRASHLARVAGVRIGSARKPLQRAYRARHQEILGWICFQQWDWESAISALKRSVDFQASASAYLRLAWAYLERGVREFADPQSREEDLVLAAEAAHFAKRMDLRGGLKTDLAQIETDIKKIVQARGDASAPVLAFHRPPAKGPDLAA